MPGITPRLTGAQRARALDAAIALTATAFVEADVWVDHAFPGPKALTTPLPILIALPLLWRRTRPLLAVALVIGGVVIQSLATGDSAEGFGQMIAIGVAAYSVAAYAERRRASIGLVVLAAGYAIYAVEDRNIRSGRASELWAGAFFGVGILAAWLVGGFVRAGRERAALEETAAARERAAHDAVVEERSRLARELHDIVSQKLSVVVVQAGGARAQAEHAPAAALEKIERSGREALVEMRRLLGVLREHDGDAGVAPQPGIDQLDELAATMRSAGLSVEIVVDGDTRDLPPALDLSAYRIVQEALTNTLRHAGATRASVVVRRDAGGVVTIDVLDDGTRLPSDDGAAVGHGLIGMRERAALFGGELRAAPRPEGGFAVHATLPLGAGS
jgi:signal transduction histidine kinase